MDEPFEMLYHKLIHGPNSKKYEYELNYVTAYYYKHIHSIVKPFLDMVNHQSFSNWVVYLSEHHVKERKKTPREIKKRRVIIRRLFRAAKENRTIYRILDLVLVKTL